MPVVMEKGASGRSHALLPGVRCMPKGLAPSEYLDIAIVNNMPDTALESTERQFIGLLSAASDKMTVRVRLFALPGVPRGDSARRYVAGNYANISELWDQRVDGLIVTGTEPRHEKLSAEPYWPAFTKLIDWAERGTTSTVWSCLAAHAAVFHLDGIARRPLPEKCFGLFECERTADHPMMTGTPSHFQVPHSRWNDLPAHLLTNAGYRILSLAREAGADSFLKQYRSLFVFLQGHPEYESSTLLREYRRDVGRYLRGERETYPGMPQRYFDKESTQALEEFKTRAMAQRSEDILEGFPGTAFREQLINSWHMSATRFYRNWLGYIAQNRSIPHTTSAVAEIAAVRPA